MPWARLDDSFHSHRKLDQLEKLGRQVWVEAVALWAVALSLAAAQKADGRLPKFKLTRLTPMSPAAVTRATGALVYVGLWEDDGDDIVFHDWARYQKDEPATTQPPAQARPRSGSAARMARKRDRDASHVTPSSVTCDAGCDAPSDSDVTLPVTPNVTAKGVTNARAEPVPSRPVPSEKNDDDATRVHAREGQSSPPAVAAVPVFVQRERALESLRAQYEATGKALDPDGWNNSSAPARTLEIGRALAALGEPTDQPIDLARWSLAIECVAAQVTAKGGGAAMGVYRSLWGSERTLRRALQHRTAEAAAAEVTAELERKAATASSRPAEEPRRKIKLLADLPPDEEAT